MRQKIVYTYYRWYILLFFVIACAFLYLFVFLISLSYKDPLSGDLFWFFTGMFIVMFIVFTLYLTHITSYRLVLKNDTLQEWRKIVPFGKSKLRFTITLPNADHVGTAHFEPIKKEFQSNTEISIFCNGFAPVRRLLSLRDYLIMRRQGRSDYPPVPSLSTFRRHQQQCLTVFWLVPIILAYIVMLQLRVHPIFTFFAYVLFVPIISYLWYTFSKLPKIYFLYTLEVVKHPLPFVLFCLTLLFLYSVLLEFSVSNAIPLAVASFVLTVILHWRYGRLLYSRAYYITFFCLPFMLFGLLLIINCVPTGKPTEIVEVPVYAKKHDDSFPPFFAVDVDIWGDGEPTGFDLKKSLYDQVEVGDTLFFAIYRGLLGVRWIKNPSGKDNSHIRKAKP